MKRKVNSIALVFFGICLSGCLKYTDIVPKGRNLLNKASDLDMLLNHDYTTGFDFSKQQSLVDEYIGTDNVPAVISNNVKNWNFVLLTYDETSNRAALANTDLNYNSMYSVITKANTVIANAESAQGDPVLARQVKAEAYILRAYMHYLAVNIYAKAYNPSTAATEGGIPYVDQLDFVEINKKNTLQEVYNKMMADVDAALATNALLDKPKNNMRVGKGFAYGVKARILMSMRKYAEALTATETALTYNNLLEDHRPFIPVANGGAGLPVARTAIEASDNLFHIGTNNLLGGTPTLEVLNVYESGNILKNVPGVYYPFDGAGIPNAVLLFIYPGPWEINRGGMTTSDLFLIKAECLIRTNRVGDGMAVINKLRENRVNPYAPLSASTESEAMMHLKKVSRIEYLFTIKNFIELKRWNREGTYVETITRTVGDKTYTLKPESPLWVFPFPQSATDFNPTLTQNY